MRKLSLPLLIVLVAAAGCWQLGDDAPLSEMSLKREAGEVVVLRGDDEIEVDDRLDLEPGDVVRTGRDGLARMRLSGTRGVQLARDGQALVVDESTVEGLVGTLLATTKSDQELSVRFGDVLATASDGTFRVDQGFGSARAGAYRGEVELGVPGQRRLNLEELFQVTVAADTLPSSTRPYHLDVRDPWDRLFLEDEVELDRELTRLGSGLSNHLGKDRPGLRYFKRLAKGQSVSFMKGYLKRSPANLLIGFTLAKHSVDRGLSEAFIEAFDLYDDGARWGIVASILEVRSKPVVAQLQRTILGTGVVAGGSGGPAQFTVAAAEAVVGSDPSDPPSSGGGTQGPPAGGGDPPPKDPPPDDPPPEDPECESVVECTVEDVTSPRPSPSPTNFPSELLDGLLENVGL